jgi:glucose/mannose-6-phosphate isomerase
MAIDLDDRAVVKERDPNGMLELTEGFPDQCREALRIANAVAPKPLEVRPGLVVLAGMGGSAAGGDLVRALFEAQGGAPFFVVRDYGLPNYVGVGDLAFIASYSGDTEETLSAYDAARHAGARIVAVTSGGELRRRAEADGYDVYAVPGGRPPRTALGYMTVPVIVACERLGLIPNQPHEAAYARLDACAKAWGVATAGNPAKVLAQELHGALPILHGLGGWQGVVANRWRSQIHENAKQLAFASAYPELDHNEVMGWIGAQGQGVARFVGVRLEDGQESGRMKARAQVTEELLRETIAFHPARAQGDSLLERMLCLTYLGDWVSLYLARLNGVDPEDIGRIDRLKSALARLSS